MTEKKKEKKREVERHSCIKCGSKFGYLRLKDKHWVCRSCGYVDEDMKEEAE